MKLYGLIYHSVCDAINTAHAAAYTESQGRYHGGYITSETWRVGEFIGNTIPPKVNGEELCDQKYINDLNDNLPGVGKPVRHSVRYDWVKGNGAFGAIDEQDGLGGLAQAVLYCITQKEYIYGDSIRQKAIWDILNGTNYGIAKELSEVAKKYQEFYDNMYTGGTTKGFVDNLDVQAKWSSESDKKVNPESGKHESKVDGVDYDTGVYKIENLGYRVEYETKNGNIVEDSKGNKIRNKYTLGPYNIDFTFNDQTYDTYTYGTNEYKLNAVENVWVITNDGTVIGTKYNQMAAYHPGGSYIEVVSSPSDGKPIETTRINDIKYDSMCDGEKINGFESKQDFYIIVHRGDLDIESFLSVEAQIDFQYIDTVTGIPTGAGLFEYEGKLVEWYWNKIDENPETWTYWADYNKNECHDHKDKDHSQYTVHNTYYGEGKINTAVYTMNRREVGDAMRLIAQSGEFKRKYNHYSVRMPGEYNPIEEYPDILVKKFDKDTGENLYGAEFRIDVTVSGKDKYGYRLNNKNLTFYRTTDRYGRARITGREIVSAGAQIAMIRDADVRIKVTEIKAPAGYEKLKDSYTASFKSNYGKITSVSGGIKEGNQIVIQAHNKKTEGNPKIQIIKVDENNKPITTSPTDLWQETMFKIHVKYRHGTSSDGKNVTYTEALVDNPLNIIRGQTNCYTGIFNITYEDLKNMPQRTRLYR